MCYERPMGIASTSRLIFKICSNPISTLLQLSFNQIKTDLIDQEIKSLLEKKSDKGSKRSKGFL